MRPTRTLPSRETPPNHQQQNTPTKKRQQQTTHTNSQMAMTGMNEAPYPDNSEERHGCSGRVGKMIFSAGVKQLAMVAYVPADQLAKV